MHAENISLLQPINQALDRAKLILFKPFDLGRWFAIGFCAWLAYLGESGFGSSYNNRGGSAPAKLQNLFGEVREYHFVQHLWWIIPAAIAAALVVLGIWIFIVWVSSRGQFMFLHCVALNKAEVRVPWYKFVREANSLFRFRLLLGLGALILMLPIGAGVIFPVAKMVNQQAASASGVLIAVGFGLLVVLVAFTWLIVAKLTRDFVVPIQFARGVKCQDAWRVLIGLLSANPGAFILYFLFQLLLTIAIYAVTFIVVLLTCCVAGCLLALPYLGTVLFLPVLVFQRSYSMYYLGQYGSEFAVASEIGGLAP